MVNSWSKIVQVGMVKNGCGQPCHGTLKLTVSQKRTDGINLFFACWYKLRKVKNWFKDFWMDVVKNGHDLLVHETLESVVSSEWIYELSWFLSADSDAIIFG